MQNVWLDTLSNWKSKMTRKPRECRSLSLRKWLVSPRIEASAKGRRELRLASSPSLSFFLSLFLSLYSGISKFPQERTLCEIWVRELSSRPTSSTVIVVVVVEKIKSARLRSLQAVWGRFYESRRWPWVAYCNSNSLSFFLSEKEAQQANPLALIVWLSVARNVSNIYRVVHRFLALNSKSTSSLVHRLHDRGINFSTRYTFIRTISRNIYIFTTKINFADKCTLSFLRHLSKLKSVLSRIRNRNGILWIPLFLSYTIEI